MLGLPQSTELNRPMPKAQLYKKFELKQAQRPLSMRHRNGRKTYNCRTKRDGISDSYHLHYLDMSTLQQTMYYDRKSAQA